MFVTNIYMFASMNKSIIFEKLCYTPFVLKNIEMFKIHHTTQKTHVALHFSFSYILTKEYQINAHKNYIFYICISIYHTLLYHIYS
jgi:hypothetical protein